MPEENQNKSEQANTDDWGGVTPSEPEVSKDSQPEPQKSAEEKDIDVNAEALAEIPAEADPKEETEASVDKAKEELGASLEKSAKQTSKPEEIGAEAKKATEKPEEQGQKSEDGTAETKKLGEELKKESAKANKSAEGAAPTKIGKEKEKQKSNVKFLISMGLGLAGLFVLFVALMVLVIARGGEDSPILTTLGLDAAGVKSFLLTVINLSFGFLAFLFFILAVIGVFRLSFVKKGDTDTKKRGVRMTLVGGIPMVFVMFIWLGLYNYISAIEIAAQRVVAEIVVVEPKNLTGLKAPLQVTFSSENAVNALQNSGYQIAEVRWDFDGDGLFETEANQFEVSYFYQLNGTYNVGLQINIEGEDEEPKQYFYPLVIEEAQFSATPNTGTAPLDVAFDAGPLLPQGTKVKSLDWDFDGDGEYELTGKDNLRPRFSFEQIGVYSVHLRVVDQNNLVSNYYRDIEIVLSDKPLLSAEIDVSPGFSGVIPFRVLFNAENSYSTKSRIVRYEWDFGDGSELQVGRSVSHVFDEPGLYRVSLTVTEETGKEDVASVDIDAQKITSAPEAKITTSPLATEGILSGDIPFKVSFDGSQSIDPDDDIVEYEWNFGDGTSVQTGQKTEHIFEAAGRFIVTLTARDADNQKGQATLDVDVAEPGVKAVIKANPQEGTAPLSVDFDGSESTTFTGRIVSYEWDFGDGSLKTITGASVTHRYNIVGTYTATLKVTTNENESAITENLVYVREIPLTACYTPSRTNGSAPLSVTFDPKCSTGSVSKYSWDFGDGETSDARKPAHTFENPGTYNIILEVSDDKNNVDTYSDVIVAEGEL